MTRQKPSLRLPTPEENLRHFPAYWLDRKKVLWRIVRDGHSAWWFGSSLEGRFDLPSPKGTCYLASDDLGAMLEALGPDLLPGGIAPIGLLRDKLLASLSVPHDHNLASCGVQRAAQWVTAEISTLTPYTIPQSWALAWEENGFQGVRYTARHSPSSRAYVVALFGPAGERSDWSGGHVSPITADRRKRLSDRCGITLFDVPSADELEFAKAP